MGGCADHTVLVLRRAWWLSLCFGGCVGTNPDWDEPDDVPKHGDDGTESSSTGDSSTGGSSDGGASDEGIDPGETDAGSTSSGGMAPICPDGEAMCMGECKDIASDKKACGLECIDCTTLYGNMARCREGVCGPKDE